MTLEVVEHVDLSIKNLGVGPEKTGVGVQKTPACCSSMVKGQLAETQDISKCHCYWFSTSSCAFNLF